MENEIKEENPQIKEENINKEDNKKDDSKKEEKQNNNKNVDLLKSKTIEKLPDYPKIKKDNQPKNNNNNNNNNDLLEKEKNEDYDSDNSALSNSDISDNESDSIKTRTESNKKMDLKTFYNQSRQYFIMNVGGTPIYSRYV